MVASWKLKATEELADKIAKSKTIGLVSINKLPSSQFQQMRKNLRGKAEIKVTKSSILRRACEKANVKGFEEYVTGQVGIVFSDSDAFKLSKLMKTTKTMSPLKPGSVSEKDIVVPAGDTPFKAGPIIGDLQKVGIKAKIQSGKIVVTEDSEVIKAGQVVSGDLANVLQRLGMKPVELGLTIKTAYEDGMIYQGDVLNIDSETVLASIQKAYAQSLNFALNAEVYNKDTVKFFLSKAFRDSVSLAMSKDIVNKETISGLLAKANMQVMSLEAAMSGEVPAAAAEAPKKEEPKSEEEAASGLAALFG